MKFGTKAIHKGLNEGQSTGAIIPPIYQTSTYIQKAPGDHKGYEYSRTKNPTRTALENNIAAIENAIHGFCFGSGMGAIDTIIKLFKSGDEIIANNDLYGGTYRIFTKIYSNYGIVFHFVDLSDPENVKNFINAKTKMIWIETPSNPLMNITDIQSVADIAKENKILLGVDNTFASPFLQNPMDLGADIVMHSATKYLGGHSDVVMGALVCNDDELAEKLSFIQNTCGAVPGPQDCFLVLRGIKTLHLRMERHSENGKRIAEYLKSHPKIDKVYWPGFEDHPNFEVAKIQMRDFGGMISFTQKDGSLETAVNFATRTKLFALAESLGGVESLVGHPATMTHAAIPLEEREKTGVVNSLIRLSVGVEDVEDLINDIEQALG
ncbi:MAG TPA: cystathionine gamma-synthase [Flavobacteriales bacterium]|nr:cystathionine gamma-synthase [Flavobacteriales bacterium]